jgi:hypothetical protein
MDTLPPMSNVLVTDFNPRGKGEGLCFSLRGQIMYGTVFLNQEVFLQAMPLS